MEKEKNITPDNEVEFEGEYLHGQKWNGRGKEFYRDSLKFTGRYSNGERKRSEYESDGSVNDYY